MHYPKTVTRTGLVMVFLVLTMSEASAREKDVSELATSKITAVESLIGVGKSGSESERISKHFCTENDIVKARRWPSAKDAVTAAAKAMVRLVECDECRASDIDKLKTRWGKTMYRYTHMLKCSLSDKDEQRRIAAQDELLRIFSGSIMAKAGSTSTLIPFLEHADSARIEEVEDAIYLYQRLKDPKIRDGFISELDRFGQAGEAFQQKMKDRDGQPVSDANLLDVLLNAERANLAMAMAYFQNIDVQSRRMARSIRGLQLVIEKKWPRSSDSQTAALDSAATEYVQAVKELIMLLTADSILKEKAVYSSSGKVEQTICQCAKNGDCQGVLLLQLAPEKEGGRTLIAPTGSMYFEPDLLTLCSEKKTDKPPTKVRSSSFPVDCGSEDEVPQCRNVWAKAATELMNKMSKQFSVFGNVAFLSVDRDVDTISPTFHKGVKVDEIPNDMHEEYPNIVENGLLIENGGCDPALVKGLIQKLQVYNSHIGRVSEERPQPYPRLSLEAGEDNLCVLTLNETEGEPFYTFHVSYTGDATPAEAGTDAGSVIGQLYMKLHMTEILAANKPLECPEPVYGSGGGPPKRLVSPARSLLFSGLPFLSDDFNDNDAAGWAYGSIESTGWLMSGIFLIPSIVARNKADDAVEGAYDRSRAYLGVTYGAIATALALRLFSVIHYSVHKHRRSKKRP